MLTVNDFRTNSSKNKAIKIDKAARIVAMMERGEFTEDGYKPRRDIQNGGYKPSFETAFTKAGFGKSYYELREQCKKGEGKVGRWFQQQLEHHRMMLSGGYKQALAELTANGVDLDVIRAHLHASIMQDLQDPNLVRKIPFKSKADLFIALTKMTAEAKSATRAQGNQYSTDIKQVIIAQIADPAAKEAMLENLMSSQQNLQEEGERFIEGFLGEEDDDD